MSGTEFVFSVPNGAAVGIRYTDTPEGAMATDYPTRALLQSEHVRREIEHIRTAGYSSVRDGGGALYTRATSEPSHAFKVQSGDGAWWEGVPEGGVRPEQLGAVGDGSTDDSTAFANALAVNGTLALSARSYRLSSQFIISGTGKKIIGLGKGVTTLIVGDGAGSSGILFQNALHCTVRDLAIQGNDDTAPLVEFSESSGNTISNIVQNVQLKGNSGGSRPAVTKTAHAGIKGAGAASGQSNYFNRILNCDFDQLFAGIDADWNANAWFVDNCKFQAVWRCFRGGFQEWMVSNVFWHSSAGSGSDSAIFAELYGESGSRLAQYNRFTNITAEPGTSLTTFYDLDVNTLANSFDADHQCTTTGTDAGSSNHFVSKSIGRFESGNTWAWRYSGDMVFGYTGGAGHVNLFGDGTTGYTGTSRKLRVFDGNAASTRHIELNQIPGGDAQIIAKNAGNLDLTSEAGHVVLSSAALEYGGELTIASGAITVTESYHRVDTEGDTSSDDVHTINGGDVDGQLLILRAQDNARTVVLKNGTGNILCGSDRSLDHTADRATLQYDSALSSWVLLNFADNAT